MEGASCIKTRASLCDFLFAYLIYIPERLWSSFLLIVCVPLVLG